ncbi:MAG: hypothetical protein JOZ52_01680, partial [Acidobacteria bacterium]|nr:hypothetical protein [Acidobacteriota bacterium]
DRLGGMVTYGGPLVRQLRNEHDMLEDLRGELPAMMLSRRLLEALAQIRLTSSTALDCYRELTEALRAAYSRPSFASAEESDFWSRTLKGMEIWADVCREIQPL